MHSPTQQHVIDQEICRQVLLADRKARSDDERLHLGDTVPSFRAQSLGGEIVSGAKVEQRHLTAIEAMRNNYPLGADINSLCLRIESPTVVAGANRGR